MDSCADGDDSYCDGDGLCAEPADPASGGGDGSTGDPCSDSTATFCTTATSGSQDDGDPGDGDQGSPTDPSQDPVQKGMPYPGKPPQSLRPWRFTKPTMPKTSPPPKLIPGKEDPPVVYDPINGPLIPEPGGPPKLTDPTGNTFWKIIYILNKLSNGPGTFIGPIILPPRIFHCPPGAGPRCMM